MKKQNSKTVGNIAEAQVLAALVKRGETVLLPYGDNERYDMVIDDDGNFLRVQCKNGRYKDGCITFSTCSSQVHMGNGRYDYRGEAEFFGVYCRHTDKAYLVPVDEVGTGASRLRVEPTKNGQKKRVRMASDYEL